MNAPSKTAAATAARMARRAEAQTGQVPSEATGDGLQDTARKPEPTGEGLFDTAAPLASATEAELPSLVAAMPEVIQIGQIGTLAPVNDPLAEIKFAPLEKGPGFADPKGADGVPYRDKILIAFVDPVIASAFRSMLAGKPGSDILGFQGCDVVAFGAERPASVLGGPRYGGMMVQKWTQDHKTLLTPNHWHKWFEELRILNRGRLWTF